MPLPIPCIHFREWNNVVLCGWPWRGCCPFLLVIITIYRLACCQQPQCRPQMAYRTGWREFSPNMSVCIFQNHLHSKTLVFKLDPSFSIFQELETKGRYTYPLPAWPYQRTITLQCFRFSVVIAKQFNKADKLMWFLTRLQNVGTIHALELFNPQGTFLWDKKPLECFYSQALPSLNTPLT